MSLCHLEHSLAHHKTTTPPKNKNTDEKNTNTQKHIPLPIIKLQQLAAQEKTQTQNIYLSRLKMKIYTLVTIMKKRKAYLLTMYESFADVGES